MIDNLSDTVMVPIAGMIISAILCYELITMVMDKNNPALYKTQSIVYLFYQNSFVENNKGYGSTIVVLLIAIIMVVTVFQMIAPEEMGILQLGKERQIWNKEQKSCQWSFISS